VSRIQIANTLISHARVAPHPSGIGIEALANFIWGTQAVDWNLPVMWGVARKYHKGVFAEIGTRSGVSTTMFALAARDVGGRVYTMDITDEKNSDARHNVGLVGGEEYVTFIHADSSKTDFPEPIDVLFIDGDHSYDGVKGDYERHAPNVKQGGVIFFHDACIYPGIAEYLIEIGAFVLPIEAGLGIATKGHHLPAGLVAIAA
jgi:hypothetical protein